MRGVKEAGRWEKPPRRNVEARNRKIRAENKSRRDILQRRCCCPPEGQQQEKRVGVRGPQGVGRSERRTLTRTAYSI